MGDPRALGKLTQSCVASTAKAGATLAKNVFAGSTACATALFACEQLEPNKRAPNLEKCRTKAAAKCQNVKNKIATQRETAIGGIGQKCQVSGPGFDVLALPNAANFTASECDCTAQTVVEGLANFPDYQSCFADLHECRLADLTRVVIPRAEELLGLGGMAPADILCGPSKTSLLARVGNGRSVSFLGARRFVDIRRAFFGALTKGVRYNPGGARPPTPGLPRRVTPLFGSRYFKLGSQKRVSVQYNLNRSRITTPESTPLLLVTVQHLDGSFVGNDAFEVDLEPDQDTVDLELAFPADLPSCDFRLAFATADGDGVSAYAPLEEEIINDGGCESDPNGNPIKGGDCYDGNLVDGDGCDHNCTKTRCGNGILTFGEACDDGNLIDGDGCEEDCTLGATPTPISTTTPPTTSTATATQSMPGITRTPTATATASRTASPTATATASQTPTTTVTGPTPTPTMTPPPCNTTVPAGSVVGQTWHAAQSPYCVTGDILVSLLTVEPGVEVRIAGPYTITIQTKVTAIGTEAEPITFTAHDPTVPWRGFLFQSTPPGSELRHCVIERSSNRGVTVLNGFPPAFEHTTIRNNSVQGDGGGLSAVNLLGPLDLSNCVFSGNSASANGGGLAIDTTTDVTIANSRFENNVTNLDVTKNHAARSRSRRLKRSATAGAGPMSSVA